MRLLRSFASLILSLVAVASFATHNRAGEIVVCWTGQGLVYEATIFTYTKLSAPADRPELTLNWGDGTSSVIARTPPSPIDDPVRDLRRNWYIAQHVYAGPGVFTLSFDDQNRNAGVVNVPMSVSQSFCVKTELTISPLGGNNCSARFLNPPIQDACFCQPWIHNPAAYDADGDSLSFEPVVCLGLNCAPITGYEYPNEVGGCGGTSYSIDPATGTISWLNPGVLGEYNIAFKVHEWRRVNGVLLHMGWVTRDMQITVKPCSNQPPAIQDLVDTCVTAGTFLSFNVQASDPNFGQQVTLTALGQPLVLANSPASFVSPSPAQSVTGVFNWQTNCSHVRLQPYQMVFNAIDNDPEVQLQDYSTMNIRIVAPAPQNPQALPNGNALDLSWNASICTNAIGYKIYRRVGTYGFVPDNCETGVPAYTGYSLIASLTGHGNTNYSDQGPLVTGTQYCYMVVACFADGAQSYASVEFCAVVDRQVPVITHVSVGVTNVSIGVDTVRWSNAYDLDTLVRPGPYQFKLYRGVGFSTATTLIYTSGVHPFLAHPDTVFIDTDLNTKDQAHVYRVDFFGRADQPTPDYIGASAPASSVFISTDPNDEQMTINWTLNTPWTNSLYEVYRDISGVWTLVGTSTSNSFTETGLENGTEYCYRVRSTGSYGNPDIVSPLLNYSQEICDRPVDRTPPCAPTVVLENDCEVPLNTLTWNNPNESCADDTYQYHVYFSQTVEGPYVLVGIIVGAENTTFTHVDGSSVSGCYQVTALDTLGNESAFITPVCGDNCPQYTLPNIITPNGDHSNDRFVPFPYRGVRSIDLTVFNRWGMVVFETTDPAIKWNGTLKDTNETLPDGVYYYVCDVIYARLAGDEVVQLKGYVHIAGGGGTQGNF
ncbi:MAG: gliding motility-associated C-terminal domain-containing protein [Flavobacteriales bacterium]|nr:gliding motility-associated C-terminal domain-containing protein [Flavobacteriales bacterium]